MRWMVLPALAVLALTSQPAAAQRGPAPRPPEVRQGPVQPVRAPVRTVDAEELARRTAARQVQTEADTRSREQSRQDRAAIEAAYERDRSGRWLRRGEIVLAAAGPGGPEAAAALGLREVRRDVLPTAGVTLYTFAAPPGARTQAAFEALQAARPGDAVDLNFVYEFEALQPAEAGAAEPRRRAADPGTARIGALIDSALPERPGLLPGVIVRTARFGPGQGQASDHALAVAEVLADAAGPGRLALLAADVSEPGPLPGASATSIARALDWAAGGGARVINMSLTGPPNAALAAVIRRLSARGVVIVAAAGNAGPRAPAPYPAALPEVVGVTAVDRGLHIWRRATQGPHVDFAAQGVKVAVAGGEWTGTSLAAPVVAGRLIREGITPEALAQEARDLGAPGRDPVYGYGYVAR